MNSEQYEELEYQLSFPHAEKGLEVAKIMHKTNIAMTRSALHLSKITDNDDVLEIGHGNCSHLPEIMEMGKNIHYTGLDISRDMNIEAKRINERYCRKNLAEFVLYDGENIPFAKNAFDTILSVNSVYFWKDIKDYLKSLYKTLKPKGRLVICYANKEFLRGLPFIMDRYKLYNAAEMENYLTEASFKHVITKEYRDRLVDKHEELVDRTYTVIVCQKPI